MPQPLDYWCSLRGCVPLLSTGVDLAWPCSYYWRWYSNHPNSATRRCTVCLPDLGPSVCTYWPKNDGRSSRPATVLRRHTSLGPNRHCCWPLPAKDCLGPNRFLRIRMLCIPLACYVESRHLPWHDWISTILCLCSMGLCLFAYFFIGSARLHLPSLLGPRRCWHPHRIDWAVCVFESLWVRLLALWIFFCFASIGLIMLLENI